jgi:DNA-directed RNA polymerase subunit RPC12/RpoP
LALIPTKINTPAPSTMGSVIDMKAWRAAHAPRPRALPQPAAEPCYFCTHCGSELFRIVESGLVHCAGCSARIRNVRARQL